MVDLALTSDRRPSAFAASALVPHRPARRAEPVVPAAALRGVGVAPWIAPHPPTDQDVNAMMAPMSPTIGSAPTISAATALSRLIYGGMASLYASFLAVTVAILIGVPVGLLAGFLGGWVDDSSAASSTASFVSGDRAGDRGHRRAGYRPHQRHDLGRHRVLAAAGAAGARPDADGQQELYVDAPACFGASHGRILWRHVCRTPSSR